MSDAHERIRVGVVGRAHGIRGAVRVFMDEPESDSLLRSRDIYLGEDERLYHIRHATRCGRFVALELEGIGDRDAAFTLTGQEVRIDRGTLRPLRNAYYACDLVGLEIVDDTGHRWGRVDDVVPGVAQDMLHYTSEDGVSGLVPFVSAHVGRVDIEEGTVNVDPEWMAELNAIYKG